MGSTQGSLVRSLTSEISPRLELPKSSSDFARHRPEYPGKEGEHDEDSTNSAPQATPASEASLRQRWPHPGRPHELHENFVKHKAARSISRVPASRACARSPSVCARSHFPKTRWTNGRSLTSAPRRQRCLTARPHRSDPAALRSTAAPIGVRNNDLDTLIAKAN